MITIIGSIVLITICIAWIVGVILRESGIISDTTNSIILMASLIIGLILMLIFL